MPFRTDTRAAFLATLAAGLVACAPVAPPTPTAPMDSPVAPASQSTTGRPEPGRPYDADEVLAAMRASRLPGGVPDHVETPVIAERIAAAIWTFDGTPWTTMSAGGSCGSETCLVELAGSRRGADGEDLWVFEVDPAAERVELISAELRVMPAGVAAELDSVARRIATPGALDGMLLTTTRWLPPPDVGRFALSYRSGGEEGSCSAEIIIDEPSRILLEETYEGC